MILTSVMVTTALLASPYSPAVQVQTIQIEQGLFAESVRMSGIVGYAEEQICLSPFEGQIEQICVSNGQKVKKGDLILRIDTSQAEYTLKGLLAKQYQYERLTQKSGEAFFLVGSTKKFEAEQQKEILLKQIQAGQIRSEIDGKIDEIYLSKGQYVRSNSPLVRIHNEQKCVWTSGVELEVGASAVISQNGADLGTAVFAAYDAVDLTQRTKQMKFIPVENSLQLVEEGEHVTAEVLKKDCSLEALVPLGTIGSENKIWIVENGQAWPVRIDVSRQNDHYVALSDEWIGKKAIFLPDSYALTPGCKVKERGV